jgi:hypothetical protein
MRLARGDQFGGCERRVRSSKLGVRSLRFPGRIEPTRGRERSCLLADRLGKLSHHGGVGSVASLKQPENLEISRNLGPPAANPSHLDKRHVINKLDTID